MIPETPPPTPIHIEYPIRFEVPIFLGGVLGGLVAGGLLISVKTETNKQLDSKVDVAKQSTTTQEIETATPTSTVEENQPQPTFYNWNDISDEAVGALIIGNSGYAKTSLACWLAGHLTKDKPAQIIALDPHANRNPLWGELGIHVISDFPGIEQQLQLLEELLDKRRQQPENGDMVIIFADELGASIKNFQDSSRVQRTLERLGSEGRKYDLMLIGMNQSADPDDIGVSAQNRNNFALILCGAAATNYAKRTWKADDPNRAWLDSQTYPCLLTGAISTTIAKHPTHHTYTTFKKKGNPPIGIEPINQLPLTIPLARETKQLSDDVLKLYQWFKRKPNVNFQPRDIISKKPFGKNFKLNMELLNPLLEELITNNLITQNKDGKYTYHPSAEPSGGIHIPGSATVQQGSAGSTGSATIQQE
ncbi:MAG: hypothetical protein AAF378_08330 [Cyanobacteria bacterium P01_A01_bin.84]